MTFFDVRGLPCTEAGESPDLEEPEYHELMEILKESRSKSSLVYHFVRKRFAGWVYAKQLVCDKKKIPYAFAVYCKYSVRGDFQPFFYPSSGDFLIDSRSDG